MNFGLAQLIVDSYRVPALVLNQEVDQSSRLPVGEGWARVQW